MIVVRIFNILIPRHLLGRLFVMYLRFHCDSITFSQRRGGEQFERAGRQNKRTRLSAVRFNCDNVHALDRISLRSGVRQAEHSGLHLSVLVRRLFNRHELQGSRFGAERDHNR